MASIICDFDQELENDGMSAELKLVRMNGTELAITKIELQMIVMFADERSKGI